MLVTEWKPDRAVTDAVLNGRAEYTSLGHLDRRWVVADLTDRGHSVREIAGWLGCSGRQVNRLRADALTRVMGGLLAERRRANEATAAALSSRAAQRAAEQRVGALQAALDPAVVEAMRRAVGTD